MNKNFKKNFKFHKCIMIKLLKNSTPGKHLRAVYFEKTGFYAAKVTRCLDAMENKD